MTSDAFGEHYYRHGCGAPYRREPHWLNFFVAIADQIVRRLRPRTALDAGCAMGFLVEALRDRGVEAEGVDLSSYAISQVRADVRPYCRVGSILEPFPRRYDVVTCIEVLEHLPAAAAEPAVANLCAATEEVLFSSSPDDYTEPTHANVQPPEYWAELFALHGFVRDVDFDAGFITPWAVRFRHRPEPPQRWVRDYERRLSGLQKENAALRAALAQLRAQLAEVETGPAWQTARALQDLRRRLAPPGSRRERWLDQLVLRGRRSDR
jgi:SAM-dependent methyltransferase